jgi:hypothetical protein
MRSPEGKAAVLAGLLDGEQRVIEQEQGGDRACWAHLVCPDCGAVASEGHAPGCQAGPSGKVASGSDTAGTA